MFSEEKLSQAEQKKKRSTGIKSIYSKTSCGFKSKKNA